MKIVLLHPTGNRNVRALITELVKAGMLIEFNTTIAVHPTALWLKFLPKKLRQEWLRRTFSIPTNKLWTHPLLEVARMILPRIGLDLCVQHERGWASVDSVYQDFDQAVARHLVYLAGKQKVDAVYAYEDGALATFTQAKALGLKCIYELPIAYWETARRLMMEEAERLPNWSNTLGGGIRDSAAKLERKIRELELADMVVCPGQFVIDSLPSWSKGKRVVMAPFGSPKCSEENEKNIQGRRQSNNRPLRVLFAGSLGQRKGLGDLFAAMRLINRPDVELVLMGSLLASMQFYRGEWSNFTYESVRPHEQVLELMRSCDIFCLPSIVEGRALVLQEAMSQGLPLIITPNTGGEDLIKDNLTGFIVPIRSPEAIAEKITWFLDNRSEITQMGIMAQEHAARYTWESYGARIVESFASLEKDFHP